MDRRASSRCPRCSIRHRCGPPGLDGRWVLAASAASSGRSRSERHSAWAGPPVQSSTQCQSPCSSPELRSSSSAAGSEATITPIASRQKVIRSPASSVDRQHRPGDLKACDLQLGRLPRPRCTGNALPPPRLGDVTPPFVISRPSSPRPSSPNRGRRYRGYRGHSGPKPKDPASASNLGFRVHRHTPRAKICKLFGRPAWTAPGAVPGPRRPEFWWVIAKVQDVNLLKKWSRRTNSMEPAVRQVK